MGDVDMASQIWVHPDYLNYGVSDRKKDLLRGMDITSHVTMFNVITCGLEE
jgi:hypothetical protein